MAYQILIGSHCCKELPLGLEICLLFTISRHPPLLSSCLGWQSVRLLPPPLSKVTDSGWSLIQSRNTGTSETQFLDFGGRVLLRKRHCSHERPRNPKFTSTPSLLYCMLHWSPHGCCLSGISCLNPTCVDSNTNPEGDFYAGSYEGNRRSVLEDLNLHENKMWVVLLNIKIYSQLKNI